MAPTVPASAAVPVTLVSIGLGRRDLDDVGRGRGEHQVALDGERADRVLWPGASLPPLIEVEGRCRCRRGAARVHRLPLDDAIEPFTISAPAFTVVAPV